MGIRYEMYFKEKSINFLFHNLKNEISGLFRKWEMNYLKYDGVLEQYAKNQSGFIIIEDDCSKKQYDIIKKLKDKYAIEIYLITKAKQSSSFQLCRNIYRFPFDIKRLYRDVISNHYMKADVITVKNSDGWIRLSNFEIVAIETSSRDYCIHLFDGKIYGKYHGIYDVVKELTQKDFIKIRNSLYVNLAHVYDVKSSEVVMVNHTIYNISRSFKPSFAYEYRRYLEKYKF